jgi:hypothetical protein
MFKFLNGDFFGTLGTFRGSIAKWGQTGNSEKTWVKAVILSLKAFQNYCSKGFSCGFKSSWMVSQMIKTLSKRRLQATTINLSGA